MTAKASTPTPQRESIAILASVYWDRERSSPWAEVYRAASDTYVGRTYDVKHYPESGAWTCNCPAIMPCKHIARCARLRRIRFFSALFAGQPPAVLLRQLAHYQAREASGMADEDDFAALDYLQMHLENQEAA